MCGVFGFISKKDEGIDNNVKEKIITELVKLSETRGKDASGIAIQTKSKIVVYKKSVSASILIKDSALRKIIKREILDGEKSSNINQLAFIGHARMETNGSFCKNINNQPVVKDGIISIHNGIIVNDEKIWKKMPLSKREFEVDTEIVNAFLRISLDKKVGLIEAIKALFGQIEGSASLAIFFKEFNYLLLATNTGSLYLLENPKSGFNIFASERFILNSLLKKFPKNLKDNCKIQHIKANEGFLINLSDLKKNYFNLKTSSRSEFQPKPGIEKKIVLFKTKENKIPFNVANISKRNGDPKLRTILQSQFERNIPHIQKLKRCKKCILPETMPFISFDSMGICNYCVGYAKKKLQGEKKLRQIVSKYKKTNGQPDCLVCLSGGRDSSYTLHFVKRVLGLNPIAYSYDWGMLTDLGRRNQARMCAELGVEHILVAADIQKKRKYISLNVKAWLRKPKLGMIPLFMAGDKQYFYYVNQLKKNNNINLVFMGENYFEKTSFKNGFAGIKQEGSMAYHVSPLGKAHLLFYYFFQYMKNPKYINSSLVDTFTAFLSYFILPHDYVNIYDFIKWNENLVNSTLTKKYSWETARDTKSTWRIGDGTAAFYNYIYYTVAGFSEHDTFRSNQIREGELLRKEAMRIIYKENMPRYQSLLWYCNTININFKRTINKINSITPIYS